MRERDIIPTAENTTQDAEEAEGVAADPMSITAAGGWCAPASAYNDTPDWSPPEAFEEGGISVRMIADPPGPTPMFETVAPDPGPTVMFDPIPAQHYAQPADMATARRAAAVMTARDALTHKAVMGGGAGPKVDDLIKLAEWISGDSHYRAWNLGHDGEPLTDVYGHGGE